MNILPRSVFLIVVFFVLDISETVAKSQGQLFDSIYFTNVALIAFQLSQGFSQSCLLSHSNP